MISRPLATHASTNARLAKFWWADSKVGFFVVLCTAQAFTVQACSSDPGPQTYIDTCLNNARTYCRVTESPLKQSCPASYETATECPSAVAICMYREALFDGDARVDVGPPPGDGGMVPSTRVRIYATTRAAAAELQQRCEDLEGVFTNIQGGDFLDASTRG